MPHIALRSGRESVFDRLERWLAAWRRLSREIAAQAELQRKLRGVDDHLLRDMGLKWTGKRLQRISHDEAS